jgi:hypothetical protein
MRPSVLLLLIVVSLSSLTAQEVSAPTPSCRKNILIYFDASGSMQEQREGRTLRDLMMDFLAQALESPDLLATSDTVTIKRFLNRPEVMPGTHSQASIPPGSRQSLLEVVRAGIDPPKELRKRDTDYLNLLSDIESELRTLEAGPGLTTYILIFSDFFYNPARGTSEMWQRHQSELSARLPALKDLFHEKHAKLILVYQQNPGTGGVDVINQFAGQPFAKRIFNIQDIAKLVDQVTRELRQTVALAPGGSRFQYSGQGLTLEIKLENPNCTPLRVTKVQFDPISAPDSKSPPLAAETVFVENVDLKEGETRSVAVPLKNVPPLQDLEATYIDHEYAIKARIHSDVDEVEEIFSLPFAPDAFSENLKFKFEAVRLRHILHRFDRLFLRLIPEGNLIKNRSLKLVEADAPPYHLELVEPKDKARTLMASTSLASQESLFVFALRGEGTEAHGLPEDLSSVHVKWTAETGDKESALGAPLVGSESISEIKTRDYTTQEIIAILATIILAVALRVVLKLKSAREQQGL